MIYINIHDTMNCAEGYEQPIAIVPELNNREESKLHNPCPFITPGDKVSHQGEITANGRCLGKRTIQKSPNRRVENTIYRRHQRFHSYLNLCY